MSQPPYQPALHVLDHLTKVDFIAVIGPTAAGKDTLIHRAMQHDPTLHEVLSDTSRAPRPGERPGIDMRFKTRAYMESRITRGEYAQVAPTVFGDLYATAPEDYATDGIALMPVLAEAVPLFQALPFHSLRCIFIVPPDWDTWQARIQAHHFSADKRAKRFAEARQSLLFAIHDSHIRLVINDDIERASRVFLQLVRGKLPEHYAADQMRAREVARSLLQWLDAAPNGAVSSQIRQKVS